MATVDHDRVDRRTSFGKLQNPFDILIVTGMVNVNGDRYFSRVAGIDGELDKVNAELRRKSSFSSLCACKASQNHSLASS